MSIVIIAALASACVLTGVEGLLRPLGKSRGLLGILSNILFLIILSSSWRYFAVYVLASTFISLSLSLLVEHLFTAGSPREARNLPRRVPTL